MIIGIGTDIIEVGRIRESIAKYGDKFLKKTFTENEISFCKSVANSEERFAARFAVKEAAMKAIGTGWQEGVGFLSIEVLKEENGKPYLKFHGAAEKILADKGFSEAFVSYSHVSEYAVAFVTLVGKA